MYLLRDLKTVFSLLSSSISEPEELEEERRLFYVAITRAMQKLYMTYALQRYRFGNVSYQMKSRFLNEIDTSKLNYQKSQAMTRHKTGSQEEGASIKYEYYDERFTRCTGRYIFQGSNRIKKGSVVIHNNFGRGRVLELSGRGDSKKAAIHFDKAGVKSIILKVR